MKKYIMLILSLTTAMLISGCGTNNKADPAISEIATINGYTFKNVSREINVTEYKKYRIKFQLTHNDLAVSNALVQMKTIDDKLGSISKLSTVTDQNGRGLFTYTPPAIFPTQARLKIVFNAGDRNLEASILISFDLQPNVSDGRATTLSIAYENGSCDPYRGIIGHYHVHAVNKKSNLPAVGIPVKMTLINGVKVFDRKKIHQASGILKQGDPISFSDTRTNFNTLLDSENEHLIQKGDNLIILPSEGKSKSTYIGGWDIKESKEDLILSEQFTNIQDVSRLTYMVGNEQRLLGGENGSVGQLANAHVEEIESTTDANGYAYFDIVYDAILSGHTVVVEAHGNENGKRIGVSKKIFLRLDADAASSLETIVKVYGQSTKRVAMHLSINPSCIGSEPLIDVPVNNSSFNAEPSKQCVIVSSSAEDMHADSDGDVIVTVMNLDENTSKTVDCKISWDGGPQSLNYEY